MNHDAAATTKSMKERWSELANEIYERNYNREDKGELIVLGSGLSFLDLTRDTEPEILSADYVFHCMYDKVAQIWMGKLRPDAFDLRILYGPDTDRYCIYVRMAEALLHYVRKGKKVVAVYYGHPGVFAMPAHRAVHIARTEGHHSVMRPGISALDYLIADIGFDPAYPGLQTFEATDMLLRRRRMDPTLHVVIWQVGVVGEFQFTPGGFENKGFDIFVDSLRETYGGDWEIIHYIAPQYVGVEPLIERFKIDDLAKPEVRERLSALSTFYVEPKIAAETDPEMSVLLGLTKAGEEIAATGRLFGYKRYARREREAIRDFGKWTPPENYHLSHASPGYDFMLKMSEDLRLQARYRVDPEAVAYDPSFTSLSDKTRKLLSIPHPKAFDAAMREDIEFAEEA